MSQDDEKLCQLIQQNTQSKVTTNFLATLRKLSINHRNDEQGFLVGCKALGKFEGRDEFLRELFSRLVGGSAKPPELGRRVRILPRLEADDGSDEEDVLIPSRPGKSVKAQSKVFFKKIDKSAAQRHKEFTGEREAVQKEVPSHQKTLRIPNLQSFEDENFDNEAERPVSEEDEHSASESDFQSSGEEAIVEDREWYNHDDDYGNPLPNSAELSEELNFLGRDQVVKKRGFREQDTSNIRIQLYPVPLDQRKKYIPQFLRSYSASYGVSEALLIGSLLETSQKGIVNPFRNPESAFSVNARKGSHLVALRRLQRDQKDRSKEAVEIAGTSLGDVLGVKDHQDQPKKISETAKSENISTDSRENIQRIRESLPVFAVKSKLVQTIRENQVTVVIGETGSGKTTQLSQYLYEAGFCAGHKLIGCTQPRRVAAMSVAKRVALEMNVDLGKEVGYSIRFEDETSSETRVKFMTDGILLREALMDETLDRYSCIILDEAHERSLNTDVMLGLLKQLLSRRRDLKVIVTSATMNAAKFSSFFGSAPQFTIPGRTFPVQLIYSKNPVEDYVESSVMQAVRIHVSTDIDSGDILIFMTGQEDVESTSEVIKEKLTEIYMKSQGITRFEEIEDVEIFTIYSALPGDVQTRIFQRLESGKRKIVVATNIAETSLTIDGIRYVIDCGYSKLKVYNPKIGLDSLVITPISQANANQRSGRAGRTEPGTAYRLYTEDTMHEDMYVQAIPEIQRTNLSNTVLLLKSLGVKEIVQFPFVDPPPIQTLLVSLNELYSIGALDKMGNLTALGVKMSKFPLQPSLSKILLISAKNGCSEEMVTIVSMLSVPQVFYRPKERQKESDNARSRFFVPESDHLTLLNVYSQWKCSRYSHRWCSKQFVHFKSLQRAREIREQLIKIMKKSQVELVSSGTDWDVLRKCICSGYAQQAAKASGLGKYSHLRTGMDIQLHPTSALYGLGELPPYVVYHELLMTSKEYICCVTAVNPLWLMEFGCLLYDARKVGGNIDDRDHDGIYSEEIGNDEDEDHEFDLELDKFLYAKKKMIESLEVEGPQKLGGSVESSRKKRNNNVQIGFKKRRPLR